MHHLPPESDADDEDQTEHEALFSEHVMEIGGHKLNQRRRSRFVQVPRKESDNRWMNGSA